MQGSGIVESTPGFMAGYPWDFCQVPATVCGPPFLLLDEGRDVRVECLSKGYNTFKDKDNRS